jgi:hypothetical protein
MSIPLTSWKLHTSGIPKVLKEADSQKEGGREVALSSTRDPNVGVTGADLPSEKMNVEIGREDGSI